MLRNVDTHSVFMSRAVNLHASVCGADRLVGIDVHQARSILSPRSDQRSIPFSYRDLHCPHDDVADRQIDDPVFFQAVEPTQNS